ncbi:MAG: MFS transporter [Micrococcales bacterium]
MSRKPAIKIPTGIWMLGFVSLLMDVSSEMIHSLLPIFMVGTLGATTLMVGTLEGFAESTAMIIKVFSGVISDWIGKRKALAVFGYGLSALTKPMFPLAGSFATVATARMADRVGKGLRGAPRDAMVAELAAPEIRGAAFGLRQTLDTIGAFTGPLLAVVLMWIWADNYRAVFWVAAIPAVLAVLVLQFGVHEPKLPAETKRANPISRTNLARLSSGFWVVVAISAIFSLARFSEAFLVLRTQVDHIPVMLVPLVMVLMNVIYSATAYPFGKLSDRVSHRAMLAWGLAVLVLSDLALAFNGGIASLSVGIVLWGVHMGMTQGLFSAIVAKHAPADLRGTAFGVFNLANGFALLASSTIAGALWSAISYQGTFIAGALFATMAALSLRAIK